MPFEIIERIEESNIVEHRPYGNDIYTVTCMCGPERYVYTGELEWRQEGMRSYGEFSIGGEGELFSHGNGALLYKGSLRYGLFNGNGTYHYPDGGGTYIGEWRNGVREGNGTFNYPDGGTYSGEWKNGVREGNGTFNYPDGGTYIGEWKNGVMEGNGTFNYPDGGGTYSGEWKNGVREGNGTFNYPDGGTYIGEWRNGVMEGNGTFNYPDGGTYSGEWRNGVREGDGTLCSSNGSEYVGVWRDGKREGQGIYTDQRGQIYRQFYSEDSLKEETAMSWKSLRGNREVGHGTLWERRGLHTMKYDESNAVIYYVYWANGALKRELKVNYRKLNELLNENRLGSIVPYAIEDVTRGLGENGRIKTLGEAQDCLKECSRQIFMDRMHLGAEGFTGGGLELENLVLLATLENSRFKLVRFCSERLSREKMEWHYENLERFLRFVGIDPGNIDNLRENFISVVISTTDLQHAVSVIVDLRILRMARNQSGSINAITKPIIIVFDSSRIIGSPEHKECNLGNIQKHCAFVNRNIQNLGSCWYHAVSATMAVVNDTDIYEGIMGSSVVKKYGLLGSYVWEFCESMDGLLNEFEIKQIQQLQIIANKNGIETIGGQLTSKLLVLESVRNDAEELLRNNRESLAVFGRRITVLIRKKEEGMRANFKGKIKNNLKRKYTGQLSKEIKKITPEFIRGKYNIRMSSREEKFLRAIEKAKVFRTVENKLKSTLSQVNRARNNEKLLQIRRFVAAENRLDPSTEERDMNGANNLVV